MIGARVGNWYVEAEVGRGALGVVYRARGYDEPEVLAAVKVFTECRDPAAAERMRAELLPLQRLDHANIAKALDHGVHAGLPFVATEFVTGTDCARLLEGGRRPWREVLSVAVQAARALKHAHNRNVLHRDLKPAHLMLTPDGVLKVLGFGVAKAFPPPHSASPAIGSAAYIPPETASGKPLTRRSDLYSLGGVLYTLVTGRPPFVANSVVELMHKQCYTLPERPAMLVSDLPPELDEFICTLLDKNPARRPGTAAAVIEELERLRGKLERKGETLAWPAKLTPDTAETPALPAALGGAADGKEAEPEPRPLLKRPGVVVPLFLLTVAALVLPFAWPSPSEEERELRRAIAEGAKAAPHTDAERGYLIGLRLAQAGDAEAARREWLAVATAFGPVESERHWVELARAGLAALDQQPGGRGPHPPPDRAPLLKALEHAKGLADAGKRAEADAAFDALLTVAARDPATRKMIEDARKSGQ